MAASPRAGISIHHQSTIANRLRNETVSAASGILPDCWSGRAARCGMFRRSGPPQFARHVPVQSLFLCGLSAATAAARRCCFGTTDCVELSATATSLDSASHGMELRTSSDLSAGRPALQRRCSSVLSVKCRGNTTTALRRSMRRFSASGKLIVRVSAASDWRN